MNYLYGFLSGAMVYSLLHWVVPDKTLDTFVKSNTSVKELRLFYSSHWDVIMAETPEVFEEQVLVQQEKGANTVVASD